jgi:protein-disulfide isomerase
MRLMQGQGVIGWLPLALIGGSCLGVVAGSSARAESATAPSDELEALQAEVKRINTTLDRMQQELTLIRQLLTQSAARPAPPAREIVDVRLADNPMVGHKDAPITLIEFSDYQCPYCARFAQTTLPALKAEYIDAGKVRYVFRDFPMDRMHPHARKAAEAAHCAGEQGQYWAMHDVLFQNQKLLEVEQLKMHARNLGIDGTAFDSCLEQGKYAAEVQKDLTDGMSAGVRGTPAFFVGRTGPDDMIHGISISGAQPITAFRQTIERLLQEKQQ